MYNISINFSYNMLKNILKCTIFTRRVGFTATRSRARSESACYFFVVVYFNSLVIMLVDYKIRLKHTKTSLHILFLSPSSFYIFPEVKQLSQLQANYETVWYPRTLAREKLDVLRCFKSENDAQNGLTMTAEIVFLSLIVT